MTSDTPPSRVEVITSVQRRRRWSVAEKIRLVEETMQAGMSVSLVARRAGVAPSLLFKWRRLLVEGGHQAVRADEDVVGTSQVRDLERRVRELERLLGRKTMEVEILRETLNAARVKKTAIAAAIAEGPQGRFPMKTVANTLGVARSNLVERRQGHHRSRGRYHKNDDDVLAAQIRKLIDQRPSYGYRRITALVNRQRTADGKSRINAKRVLRIMQINHFTLESHTGRRPGRTHDGVVITLRSNMRWCSDHFELACRDQQVVRVLFAIDACDREIVAWSATTAGISGEMVRDLMIDCVERRFAGTKVPHPIEWLSDNGSAYIARDTLDTATALGLHLCFTPVRSPESNGICEAFVKTLKRDYARLSILPNSQTVLALLPSWFEDYNEVHPHSGLKFRSPREFLRMSA